MIIHIPELGLGPLEIDLPFNPMNPGELMKGDLNPMSNSDVYETHNMIMRSAEYRQKMSEIKKGFKHSDSTKEKMSESAKRVGTGKWLKGRAKSEEWKDQASKIALKRERIPCEKCGKGITKANYKKHYNACS